MDPIQARSSVQNQIVHADTTDNDEMPKRVLYLEATRNGVVGGSLICLYHLLRGLNRQKYDPVVIFHSTFPVTRDFERLSQVLLIPKPNRPPDTPPSARRSRLKLVRSSRQLLIDLLPGVYTLCRIIRRQRISLIHLNNGLDLDLEGLIAAKLSGIRCVVHQRGFGRLSRMPRCLAKYADAVISVSQAVGRDLQRQQLALKRSSTIYDGIDLMYEAPHYSRERIRAELGVPQRYPLVGIVGTIQPWKGQRDVLLAIKRVAARTPNIRCLIVGGVYDPHYYEELHRLAAELNLAKHILFVGYRSDVLDVINAMDVLVHASTSPEPFGRVLIEAMALRKPVIATNAGGPTEIVKDHVTGLLVPPGDPEALANALTRLIEGPSFAARLSHAGRQRVETAFTLQQTIRDVEALYDAVL